MGEDSIATIKREFKEELGENITVDRMLWCAESFYDHRGFGVHELCLYYAVQFKEDSKIVHLKDAFKCIEIDGSVLTFKWLPLEELQAVEFYPTFVKNQIVDLPKRIEQVIDRE